MITNSSDYSILTQLKKLTMFQSIVSVIYLCLHIFYKRHFKRLIRNNFILIVNNNYLFRYISMSFLPKTTFKNETILYLRHIQNAKTFRKILLAHSFSTIIFLFKYRIIFILNQYKHIVVMTFKRLERARQSKRQYLCILLRLMKENRKDNMFFKYEFFSYRYVR